MTSPFSATPSTKPPRTVALVLGSGGARGNAHIGVIDVLHEAGLEIVAVSGSSMGALVGGLHAAGVLHDYREWAQGLGQFEILRLLDVSFRSAGAIVRDLIGDVAIEDLPIPFTAVAADLLAHREVWFQKGPLEFAIRASAAIPSVLTPVIHNGRVLVDGGLINPVPVAPISATSADLVIAVSLNGQGPMPERPVAETAEEAPDDEWAGRLRGAATRWFDREVLQSVRARLSNDDEPKERKERGKKELEDPLGKFDVMNLAIETSQTMLTRLRLASYAPDILIEVPNNACRTLDFHRAAEMIDLGRVVATEALRRGGITVP